MYKNKYSNNYKCLVLFSIFIWIRDRRKTNTNCKSFYNWKKVVFSITWNCSNRRHEQRWHVRDILLNPFYFFFFFLFKLCQVCKVTVLVTKVIWNYTASKLNKLINIPFATAKSRIEIEDSEDDLRFHPLQYTFLFRCTAGKWPFNKRCLSFMFPKNGIKTLYKL